MALIQMVLVMHQSHLDLRPILDLFVMEWNEDGIFKRFTRFVRIPI
jgi:hypothetical protein